MAELETPTPTHAGPLGSGGHGYNEDMTDPSSTKPVEHAAATTQAAIAAVNAPNTRLGGGFWLGLLVFLLVLAGVVVYGIHARSKADTTLAVENKQESTPEVKVVHPSSQGTNGALVLPGNTMPFVDTPIFSRTNGYLSKWFFDIGARVKKGQLMAVIETPELDQQLQVAEADLKSAQANLNLANITSARYQNLLKSNSVSKQETDQAMGDAEAKQAAVEASMANVRRLQQLQGFENVYAPFDGVVTARNTDIGDLITGGSANASTAKQLFHLAAIGTLRVFVAVPEIYSSAVRNGGSAELTLDEFPGQTFDGIITRNSSAIDPASRTLNVEVDVPNSSGKLLPGAYAMVHIKVPAGPSNVTIPSDTLIFRAQGMQVAVVRNNKVVLTPVKISQDHGATVDVSSGLTTEDAIILDPSDSITNGMAVKVAAK
jgi:RND family efflux transporter MFP subunit